MTTRDKTERQQWMGLMARAPQGQLATLCLAAGLAPTYDILRQPEVGTVMVRGRTGGTGAPFNLGEVTVTRASVQLASGAVGHGYIQGRDKSAAEWAAVVDALMQGPDAARTQRLVLDPIAAGLQQVATERAAKAAATKVEFFTLVRGEN
jgi:alpha-D-ribose 1-methylphosphonate 5-triphosphate synthase subunit PhnG